MTLFTTKVIEGLFLTIAAIAAVCCLARPDYNLPLFLFAWWVFFHIPDETLSDQHLKTAQALHEWHYDDNHHKRMHLLSKRFRQQRVMLGFIIVTLAQDVLFLLYWPSKWFSKSWQSVEAFTRHFHEIVCVWSLVELILKAFVVLALLVPGSVLDCGHCCAKPDEFTTYEVQTYSQQPPRSTQYDYHVVPSEAYAAMHHVVTAELA